MATADEYRQFAEECLRWARIAKTDAEKKAFLDMARTLTKSAAKLTNGEAVSDFLIPPSGEADPAVPPG